MESGGAGWIKALCTALTTWKKQNSIMWWSVLMFWLQINQRLVPGEYKSIFDSLWVRVDVSWVVGSSYVVQDAFVFTQWNDCGHMSRRPAPNEVWVIRSQEAVLVSFRSELRAVYLWSDPSGQMLIPHLNGVKVILYFQLTPQFVLSPVKTLLWRTMMYNLRFENKLLTI